MAINWPDSPVDGTEHVEEQTTWVYQDPPGCWQVGSRSGGLQTIVDGDDGVSWQVWGDLLIQFGAVLTSASGNVTVNLPIAYDSIDYEIVVTANALASSSMVSGNALHTDGGSFQVGGWRQSGSASARFSANYSWITVGPAPDNLKMPKEVINPGPVEVTRTGDGYLYTADKLIQWGGATGSAEYTFLKPFASSPRVTLTRQSAQADAYQAVIALSETAFTPEVRAISNGAPASVGVNFIAIGDAPADEALPTTVMGNAVQEYHDPATVAPTKNWRLIGRTLEVWGTNEVLTSGTGVTMPMPFASDKWSVSLASRSSDATADATAIINDASTMTLYSTSNNRTVTWHAIGEVG